jgi:hypothetical protein
MGELKRREAHGFDICHVRLSPWPQVLPKAAGNPALLGILALLVPEFNF